MNGFPEQTLLKTAPDANLSYGTSLKLKRNNNFYVYVYLDPRKKGTFIYGNYFFDYEPFYVGKGIRGRVFNFLARSGACKNKIQKLKSLNIEPIIQIIKTNYSEKSAHIVEKKLIKLMGRQDLKTGILCNHTDGGEGSSGYKHSLDSKIKISKIQKGRKHSEEENIKKSKRMKGHKYLLGHKHTEEAKRKISLANKGNKNFLGKHHSEEAKRKISFIHKGVKLSKEHKIKISLANKGKIRTEEMKKKISLINKGKKHSEETKLKMSMAGKGKKHSKEHVKKVADTIRGKCRSEETKRKISETLKRINNEKRNLQ